MATGFVDKIRPLGAYTAKIMLVVEAPTGDDMRTGTPLSGALGTFFTSIMEKAGIKRYEVFVTSVLRTMPPMGDASLWVAQKSSEVSEQHVVCGDKYVHPQVALGVGELMAEIKALQPNIVIASGNLASWACTGNWSSFTFRGSLEEVKGVTHLDGSPIKCIATYSHKLVSQQTERVPVVQQDLRRAKAESQYPELIRPNYEFIISPDYRQTMSVLAQISEQLSKAELYLGADIETCLNHIDCISLAWTTTAAICIPFLKQDYSSYWTEEQEVNILNALRYILTHKNCKVVGQNWMYDAQFLYRWWFITVPPARDTMLMQHTCFPSEEKSLAHIASIYCQHYQYWKDEGKVRDDKLPMERRWVYNCKDSCYTLEGSNVLVEVTKACGMEEQSKFQHDLWSAVFVTTCRGLRRDEQKRQGFAIELMEESIERRALVHEIVGYELNISSPPQMQDLFYRQLGIEKIYSRKERTVTVNDEALSKIAAMEPLLRPLIKKIQELRSLGVFYATFVEAKCDMDGRVRCFFNIAGTETFRFSSKKDAFGSGLNLQNIPAGGESAEEDGLDLPNVRTLFIPDPGHTFFDIDLASADLRIVVWDADEPEMKAMLNSGADPYTEVGKEFFQDPSFSKKDPRRNQFFKPFCHGTHYHGTPKGLAERLGISVQRATETQQWYFRRFPRIKHNIDELRHKLETQRYVDNIFGYKRHYWQRIEGTVINEAAAWRPQSTVACLINRGYLQIHKTLPDVQVLLQVHDSLAGQYPTHLEAACKPAIIRAAEIPLPYADPLTIPVGVKTSTKSWGDCQ